MGNRYSRIGKTFRDLGNLKRGRTRYFPGRFKIGKFCFQLMMSSNLLSLPIACFCGWGVIELLKLIHDSLLVVLFAFLVGFVMFLTVFYWLGGWIRMTLFLYFVRRSKTSS